MFDWDTLLEPARKAADADALLASNEELCAGVAVLEQLRAVLDAAEGHLLAEVAARDITIEAHGLRTSVWLGREGNIASHTASTRVRVGQVLAESLQCTDARLISARISFHHARVLADAFTYSPAAEHIKAAEVELLDLAEGMVFDVWARHVAGRVREYEREHQNRDPGTVEPDPRRREFLKLSPTWDGRLRVRGYLNDVAGAVTGETLNRVADELFHQFTHTHKLDPTTKIPGRGELLSMALVETCRRASTSDPATSRAATPEVTLVVHADEPDTAYTPEGVKLQDNTIRTLLCDPAMFPIVVSSLGVPLDMGRDIRHVNGAQRRALEHRDGGCTFQGCPTPPRWCDAHHIDWWDRDNGTTDVKKSTLACRFHHHLIHNHNWTVHLTDDGWTIWTNPQRKPIWGQQHHRTRAGPTPNR